MCGFVEERDEGAGLIACSELDLSLSPSERDLRFPPVNTAAVMVPIGLSISREKTANSVAVCRRFPFWLLL